MYDSIHIYCGSSDINWCAKNDLYKCEGFGEFIYEDELTYILEIDNTAVISIICQEAV